ncbi:MAG TPA: hypothetical protein VLB80_05075 [Candidatus Babeliales bacterium]|nr:hypothetical protein [Candidatus Babeliales bacterium]
MKKKIQILLVSVLLINVLSVVEIFSAEFDEKSTDSINKQSNDQMISFSPKKEKQHEPLDEKNRYNSTKTWSVDQDKLTQKERDKIGEEIGKNVESFFGD